MSDQPGLLDPPAEEIVIDSAVPATSLRWRELYGHRELLLLFVRRLLAARYRQMALGTLWLFLEPLLQLLMISVVFGLLLKVSSKGYPYAVYTFAGLTPWWLFSRTTLAVAGCLQDNMALISKVYFPRLLLAIAAAAREYVDAIVALMLLLVVATAFGYSPGPKALLAPLLLIGVLLTGSACGLWVAALMVRFRDIRPALGLLLQAAMYATPVVYDAALVPPAVRTWYEMNPMYWAVESFRWLLLDAPVALSPGLPVAVGAVLVMLILGLKVFSVQERRTVDVQ